ncbi:hypothetical protein TCAL_12091 [Tigriopus californicus]|uniref:5-hydroxyisourate hydrolase n=1 Tax=Tigriopus californicus TaxID=6832 RepID=A0A553NPL7_TIGCA|nr:5-hydroxyisourate hydrolase-like [Tigriopus californicus]TRY67374.1 hypothetical protein TCAL_12091 [Tigriopus californicus]|eukprot:TCALIF_12091-PA protein Name:"Similar to urah 5-hydroxyisourate hydrolase (Danio rerio)" AED:0.25 eAED:0.25 QI:21/1/1/1/0/0/3/59/123
MSGARQSFPDPISSHVLDTSAGVPGRDIPISLWKLNQQDGKWLVVGNRQSTNNDGRASAFLTWDDFTIGVYKAHFEVAPYFQGKNQESFFPFCEIVFEVKNADQHYHIPLLLSPFSYTTYRGS